MAPGPLSCTVMRLPRMNLMWRYRLAGTGYRSGVFLVLKWPMRNDPTPARAGAGAPSAYDPSYRPPAPIPLARPMGRIAFLARLRDNPVTTWGHWHFSRPIVAGPTMLGHMSTISDPAGIRHIFVDNAKNYVKDALQLRILRPGLGDGLLTAEGDTWKRTRRTLAPLFSPRAVESFAGTMQECADRSVARLARAPGSLLDISAEMTRVTFDILAATLFSNDIEADADRFADATTQFFNTVGKLSPLDALGAPDWIPRIGRLQARPALRFFEEQVKAIIARRHAALAAGAAAPRDLLTLLLEAADPETGQGLTEAEVGANIVTFIGAGHETTANTLSWALFLLAKHPEVCAALEREAEAAHDVPLCEWPDRLVLARAVIEEAQRLYPPAATLTRAAIEDDIIRGTKIPAGSTVVVSPYVVHRHRTLWSDPDRFRPARFLPGAREKIDRFAFIPFGAGARICIGARFAMFEAVIVLVTLARSLRLTMDKGASVFPVQRVTLRPSPRLEMRVQRR